MALRMILALSFETAALLLSLGYFRRYTLTRPPIGVLNMWDMAIIAGIIVVVHILNVVLPLWVVVGIIVSISIGLLHLMLTPMFSSTRLVWSLVLILTLLDVVTLYWFGLFSMAFILANSLVQTIIVVGVTNLWVQGGVKARDVVILALILALFDYVATSRLSLMNDVIDRLTAIPFAPLIAGLGFGDILMAALFPLVMRKAFGVSAGIVAIGLTLFVSVLVLGLIELEWISTFIPMMVVFAPLMLLQYLYWHWQRGSERTMVQYLQAEPTLNP